MARIRSIHPGIFTDEAFASLSMGARVLLLGVWTEADDHGVFEWKPVTLKMRVMPVDNVSIPDLLAECERADVIKRFTSGKSYGLVRNFCRYQRPKKPKYVHPIPSELYTYAGLKEDGSLVVLHQSRTGGEIPPQREEEGGEGEEESGIEDLKSRDLFEEFWKEYPRRDSDEQRERSQEAFIALLRMGVDPKVITFVAKAYCAKTRKQNNYATRFVKVAWRWLAEQDFSGKAPPAADAPTAEPAEKDWRTAVKAWLLNESNWPRWAGNTPGSSSCRCPPEILAELSVCPNTGRRIDETWWYAEEDTPELRANLSFAAEHRLKIRLYDFTRDGVTKQGGAFFMKRIPPGYDEATGERIAPPENEVSAA